MGKFSELYGKTLPKLAYHVRSSILGQALSVEEFVHRISLVDLQEIDAQPDIARLIEKRRQARLHKDWRLADQLRDQLITLGVDVRDQKID